MTEEEPLKKGLSALKENLSIPLNSEFAQFRKNFHAVSNPKIFDIMEQTLFHPEQCFPPNRAHLSKRLSMAVEKKVTDFGVNVRASLLPVIVELVKFRTTSKPQTVFIVNPGGSGSHWLQDILCQYFTVVGCGEVYIPADIMTILKDCDEFDRGVLIDFFHILFSEGNYADLSNTPLINTAHLGGWKLSNWYPSPKFVILLTRDPIDIVMSRTFRKDDYRMRYFKHEDDWEYLHRNIAYVENFFSRMKKGSFDLLVKYEDLKHDYELVIRKVSEKSDLRPRLGGICETISELRNAALPLSNKYSGPKKEIGPDFLEEARCHLLQLRTELGYA